MRLSTERVFGSRGGVPAAATVALVNTSFVAIGLAVDLELVLADVFELVQEVNSHSLVFVAKLVDLFALGCEKDAVL